MSGLNPSRLLTLQTALLVWAGALAMEGCKEHLAPPPDVQIRVGVESDLHSCGFAPFLQASYEATHKVRTRFVADDPVGLQRRIMAGELDVVLMAGRRPVEQLEQGGVSARAAAFAHEELVFIGPVKDQFRAHGSTDAVDMLKNITRSNYKYLVARKGSVEERRHATLARRTGDRGGIGSHLETQFDGIGFFRAAIARDAFALVRRSALVRGALAGVRPNRVYRDGDPDLVLGLYVVQIAPAKSGRPSDASFYDFVAGAEGRKIVERFGVTRYGLPLFGAGLPEEGQGASLTVVPKGGSSPGGNKAN